MVASFPQYAANRIPPGLVTLCLIFHSHQMIHRAEQQGDVVGVIFEFTKVPGVRLGDRHLFFGTRIFLKDLDVVFQKLYGIHLIALTGEMMAITSGGRTDLKDQHTGPEILFNVPHGRQEFDLTMF